MPLNIFSKGVRRFKVDDRELSSKEKVLFRKLIKAAELIAPIYLKQKNDKYPGANFYPKDATKEEIQKAAEDNPLILNPYTMVERDRLGKLIAIPYHIISCFVRYWEIIKYEMWLYFSYFLKLIVHTKTKLASCLRT